jgi:hypothetical protein
VFRCYDYSTSSDGKLANTPQKHVMLSPAVQSALVALPVDAGAAAAAVLSGLDDSDLTTSPFDESAPAVSPLSAVFLPLAPVLLAVLLSVIYQPLPLK